jgi:hypothetical protein
MEFKFTLVKIKTHLLQARWSLLLENSKFFVSYGEESMAGHMGVNGVY